MIGENATVPLTQFNGEKTISGDFSGNIDFKGRIMGRITP
jgi:hypothetical protein